MESLFMQLAMAAMSQFGGGRSVTVSGGMPMPLPMRTLAPYSSPAPVSNGWQPSMQAIKVLDRQGETWGWGRSVPISVVDLTIDSAGGCRALLNGNSPGSDWQGAPIQVADGDPGRSQREGFGLYFYR